MQAIAAAVSIFKIGRKMLIAFLILILFPYLSIGPLFYVSCDWLGYQNCSKNSKSIYVDESLCIIARM